jgi:uncharacterized glyoxalase superfamily protein PhnB
MTMAENLTSGENVPNNEVGIKQENPNPKISFITLGVKNLAIMTRFYRDVLGWQMEKEQEGVSFFKMNGGTVFALFSAEDLAKDIGLKSDQVAADNSFKKMSLALNFDSIIKVDAFFAFLKQKGVYIQKAPQTVFWGGYSGYFKDPEDNYWEVAYNPFL